MRDSSWKIDLGIVAIGIILGMIGIGLVGYSTAQIQTSSIEKRFTTCVNSIPELDNLRYSNGRQISYDIIGCPITNIVIHDWQDINVIDKASVTNTLSAKGYIEKEEISSDSIAVGEGK